MSKQALGRGLEAILPGKPGGESVLHRLPVHSILPNRSQPRTAFAERDLRDLTDSVRQHGILHPILVRRTGDGAYEIIAGERRFRAAKLAKLTEIPAVIRQSRDDESTSLALIENIQRVNLNPVEEAGAYRRLMDEFGLTQEEVAGRVGRDRASVANICRVLALPRAIRDMVASGQLTLGHAKSIVSLTRVDAQLALAARIVREQLSVRQVERLVKQKSRVTRRTRSRAPSGARPLEADVEDRLRKRLRTKVTLRAKARGGDVIVAYYSREDLTRIVDVMLS